MPLYAAPKLELGTVSGAPGTAVELPIRFDAGGASIASMQFELTLPAGLSAGSVSAGEALNSENKTVSARVDGRKWRFIIFGLNQTPIGSRPLLTAQVKIASGTPIGDLRIPIAGVLFVNPKGSGVASGRNKAGVVKIASKS